MKKEVSKKINLRELDDIACSNVIVSRQIKRLVNKFPSMKSVSIDCWTHGRHYELFECKNDKFIWSAKKGDSDEYIKTPIDSEELFDSEMNKLIVTTYRTMCDSQTDESLLVTTEELLAYAESKLQELLHDEGEEEKAV